MLLDHGSGWDGLGREYEAESGVVVEGVERASVERRSVAGVKVERGSRVWP